MKKHVLKGILGLLLMIPLACVTDDCGDFKEQYINLTEISGSNFELIEDGYSIKQSLDANGRVRYDRFGLQILPVVEYLGLENVKPVQGLIPTAYACSPAPSEPTEEIADITIFSSAEYTQANSTRIMAAGDTLNALFNIYDRYSGRIVGLTDFLVEDHLKASDQGFILQPAVMPAAEQTHEFTVHYRLTNNEFYSVTTMPVSLIP